jgi:hypothetical protein
MTSQQESEHIITAREPAWTEQRFRPGEDGTPKAVPDTMEIHHAEHGPRPRYVCSCGAEFRNWGAVKKHCEEVARGKIIHTRPIPDDQTTLSDI